MSTFNKYRTKGAYHYEWYATEDWYKYFIDRAVNFCKGSTLDFGCGDGVLANMVAENGWKTLGIDKDPDAIELAKQQNGIAHFVQGDVQYVGNHDYLCCINVIEHLDNPQIIWDMVAFDIEKGAIITTIDYQGGSLGEDHKFEWTYDEMMDFFKEFNPKGFRYKDTEWIGVEITK